MTLLSFKINANYGFEFCIFNKVRECKDGLTFFEFVTNLDTYHGDHSPRFETRFLFFNWMIFEMNVYYLHHKDEEGD